MIKKSLKLLKEKFYPLFFSELVFLFATFFFLVFAKNKLATYVLKIQEYSANAATIQQGADQVQLMQFLEGFQAVTSNAIVFAYILIPLVLAVIWIATQSWFWYALKSPKIKHTKAFFLKAILMQVVVLLVIYGVIVSIPQSFSLFDTIDVAILKGLLTLILGFVLFIVLATLENQKKFTVLKEILQTVKRSHKVVIPFILLFVVFLGLSFLFFSLFTTYMAGQVVIVTIIPLTLYLIIMMLLFMWLKVIFYNKIQEI